MTKPLLRVALALLLAFALIHSSHADPIWAEVDGSTVTVYHLGAVYNCCWVLDAELYFTEGTIDLYEIEGPGSEYCYCFCELDLSFHFEVNEPGDYLLRVWYLRTEDGSYEYELVAELPIVIEEEGEGLPLWSDQSDCGGWVTGAPEPVIETGSWSVIKKLYR